MDLSKILAISGKPGLYMMLSETKTGLLVEAMDTKKRFPVFAHEKISSLEEISIFTEDEDLPLKEVLKKIYDSLEGKKAPDHKSDPKELKAFFKEAVPEYDEERVYNSDIKKVIHWYNQLHEHKMLDFTAEEEEEEEKKEEDKATPADEKD
jgi:hypothetical protein